MTNTVLYQDELRSKLIGGDMSEEPLGTPNLNITLGTQLEIWRKPLSVIAYRILKDYDLADDAVSESFLQYHEHQDDFEGRSKLFTYLYRIVVNRSINMLRKLRREEKNTVSYDAYNEGNDSGLGSQEAEGQKEIKMANPVPNLEDTTAVKLLVKEALAKLPEYFREPLVLCDMNNLSYDEIANDLELPINTVRTRIHRARTQLTQIFREMGVSQEWR